MLEQQVTELLDVLEPAVLETLLGALEHLAQPEPDQPQLSRKTPEETP